MELKQGGGGRSIDYNTHPQFHHHCAKTSLPEAQSPILYQALPFAQAFLDCQFQWEISFQQITWQRWANLNNGNGRLP